MPGLGHEMEVVCVALRGSAEEILFWQGFVRQMTARCKVTGFVTGNISERFMKGLATDVETLLTVRFPVLHSLP